MILIRRSFTTYFLRKIIRIFFWALVSKPGRPKISQGPLFASQNEFWTNWTNYINFQVFQRLPPHLSGQPFPSNRELEHPANRKLGFLSSGRRTLSTLRPIHLLGRHHQKEERLLRRPQWGCRKIWRWKLK